MRDQMLDHGLDPPLLATEMGYFQVTFQGPGENIERLRIPEKRILITPSVEARLNERQKKMVKLLLKGIELTSRECEARFGVTRPVISRELGNLVELGLAVRVGAGRSVRYRLKP